MQIVATVAALLAIATPLSAQPSSLEVSGGVATMSLEGDYNRWHTSAGFAQALAGIDRRAFTARCPLSPDDNEVGSAFVSDFAGAAIIKPWYAETWQISMWRLRVACVYRLP